MNKKLLSVFFAAAFISTAFAQESGGSKKFRFGLKGIPSLNWYRPDESDDNKIIKNGVGLGLGWGLITEFSLTDNVVLSTGLQLDNDRGKLRYESGDTSQYKTEGANYIYSTKLLLAKEHSDTVGKTFQEIHLTEREYMVKYITLPAVLKMKTKEIGYFTYFGQFGFLLSFKTKAIANDKGNNRVDAASYEKTKIDVASDVNLFRFQLSVGGGAEWNLAGSTSLTFGLNYNRGFSNVLGGLSKKSNHLYMVDKNGNVLAFSQKAFADNVALTVGILF